MNTLHKTLVRGISDIQLAATEAADIGGALDEATQAMKEVDESEFADLLSVDNRFSGKHEYRIERIQDSLERSRGDWLMPTGYLGVIDLDYKAEAAYALFSMTGGLDPENEVQQTVNGFATEDRFCIASMALAKGLRQLAFRQRSPMMRSLSPIKWAIETRGTPLTLGWGGEGKSTLVSASGFMPNRRMNVLYDMYYEIIEHFEAEPESTKAFRGSGLSDEVAIGNNQHQSPHITRLALDLLEQGANLN